MVWVKLLINHGSFYQNLETQTLVHSDSCALRLLQIPDPCMSPSALISALLSSLGAIIQITDIRLTHQLIHWGVAMTRKVMCSREGDGIGNEVADYLRPGTEVGMFTLMS